MRDEAIRFDDLARAVGQELAGIQRQYGFKLFQKQSLQSVMSDVIIPTYGMLAVLVRAVGVSQSEVTPQQSVELATAVLAMRRLEAEATIALAALRRGADDDTSALVEAVLAN